MQSGSILHLLQHRLHPQAAPLSLKQHAPPLSHMTQRLPLPELSCCTSSGMSPCLLGGKATIVSVDSWPTSLPWLSSAARQALSALLSSTCEMLLPFLAAADPMCIKMMENKRIDVGSLITHRYPFTGDGMEEAFDTAYRQACEAVPAHHCSRQLAWSRLVTHHARDSMVFQFLGLQPSLTVF